MSTRLRPPPLAPGPRFPRRRDRLRQRAGAFVIDNGFIRLALLGRRLPPADPARHGVEVLENLPVENPDWPEAKVDVYRPAAGRPVKGTAVYFHGGGFRILNKDTHWLMGLAFARNGYVTFVPDYRPSPEHPFPTPVSDAAWAWKHAVENAESFGGTLDRLVVTGESAGGNLALCVGLAAGAEFDEPWAQVVREARARPHACVPFCGLLQVSEPERLWAGRKKTLRTLQDRFHEIAEAYLDASPLLGHEHARFADPLVVAEQLAAPLDPAPSFFIPVGGRDLLKHDARRLEAALLRHGHRAEAREYPAEVHAFHAFVWRKRARQCWRDVFNFLDSVPTSSTVG